KQTEVHNLKDAIEKRLARMLAQNPLRTNFQERYEQIVAKYNSEKDRVTIETTFEALLKLVASSTKSQRAPCVRGSMKRRLLCSIYSRNLILQRKILNG